ncbi:DUF4442 domain-containing protein [Robiginitalea sp. M366]|uniref:DUF4442 domain-containing protein n=1 Tax=Robiginitalea aestuariiviva TaxID=3036903 RepID=UPI00240D270A|nr:DUF4442 domain-containing protein [Robiginitalea aestuariiviva]MDG1573396.1 DUF4442 domain-containing protein [Robiginitalea aestuariiviva]
MASLVRKFNGFMFLKLPSAWWCGVRLQHLDGNSADTRVTHRWINQNPFRSMFWAVQGMAAEFATGALVMYHIRKSGRKVSMLVLNNTATFTKKATGRIRFRCEDGPAVQKALAEAVRSGEGQTVWMTATGIDAAGDPVSTFRFEWTLKVK